MTTYRIDGWEDLYENSRSKTIKTTNWVPMPNSFSASDYVTMNDGTPEGALAWAGWTAIVLVASKAPKRGVIVDDRSRPMSIEAIAKVARMPAEIVRDAWRRGLLANLLIEADGNTLPPVAMEGNALPLRERKNEGKEEKEVDGAASWDAALSAHDAARDALYAEGKR